MPKGELCLFGLGFRVRGEGSPRIKSYGAPGYLFCAGVCLGRLVKPVQRNDSKTSEGMALIVTEIDPKLQSFSSSSFFGGFVSMPA